MGTSQASARPTAQQRQAEFYRDRYRAAWGSRNIFAGVATPGQDAIIVYSNDYLDIGCHPSVVDAEIESLRRCGNGVLMSGALVADSDDPLLVLERRFAGYLGVPAAILCQSGWAANVGLLQVIAGPEDHVYIDNRAHMSLWEGARLSGARIHSFRHNATEHLRERVAAFGSGIVLIDSVYSGDGTICPLVDLVSSARSLGCTVVVDESHSLGTHGPMGSGLVAELGLTEQVDHITASLSKALVGRAGLLTCGKPFVGYFKVSSFPAVFSSTLLPHDVAGLDAALSVVQKEDWRRKRLAEIAATVRAGLLEAGVDINGSESQIIPLMAGSEASAAALRDELQRRDIFGAVFIPPATNPRRSMVRLSLHAGLTDRDVGLLVKACVEATAELR